MPSTILLESDTNEVEILEFFLGRQSFGINVAKIAQIIPFSPEQVTTLPSSEPAVRGSLLWQGRSLPLLDLERLVNRTPTIDPEQRPVVLITAFNNSYHGFLISGVNRITRIRWETVKPLSNFLGRYSSAISGTILLEKREVLLIDFEYLVATLLPAPNREDGFATPAPPHNPPERGAKKIFFAEDSPFIRETIGKLLHDHGYRQLKTFNNGREAYHHFQALHTQLPARPGAIREHVDLIISDIEMPEMDGLTLCRNLKQELGYTELPVILFSSLINSTMIHKCREVGADAYTSKPQIKQLLLLMDQLLAISAPPA